MSKEALQIAERRREAKGKEEKQKAKKRRKVYPFECRVPKNSKER